MVLYVISIQGVSLSLSCGLYGVFYSFLRLFSTNEDCYNPFSYCHNIFQNTSKPNLTRMLAQNSLENSPLVKGTIKMFGAFKISLLLPNSLKKFCNMVVYVPRHTKGLFELIMQSLCCHLQFLMAHSDPMVILIMHSHIPINIFKTPRNCELQSLK